MTLDDFRALPQLSSFFPLVYPNKARWTSLDGECLRCSQRFPDDDLRGNVKHPIPRVFVVDAMGYCAACELLTPIKYRLHDDMSMSSIKDGAWVSWGDRPTFRKALSDLWKGIIDE